MKKIFIILFISSFTIKVTAQHINGRALSACGKSSTTGNRSLSWTMGEPFSKKLENDKRLMTMGVQQPLLFLRILNVKTFIEGYYLGGGLMQPVLYNNSLTTDPTICDSIAISLCQPTIPFGIVATAMGLLHTNGSVEVKFKPTIKLGSYYLAIIHQNGIETWSKTPVNIKRHTTYEFMH